MAQHIGTVTKSSRLPDLPFHAQCSCGTAGTFPEKESALQYLRNHGLQQQALGPANSFKLVDDSDKPEVVPGRPSTHVGGIGNMPVSHAALADERGPFGTDPVVGVQTEPVAFGEPAVVGPEPGVIEEPIATGEPTWGWNKKKKK
jgi:hypothetical protein